MNQTKVVQDLPVKRAEIVGTLQTTDCLSVQISHYMYFNRQETVGLNSCWHIFGP